MKKVSLIITTLLLALSFASVASSIYPSNPYYLELKKYSADTFAIQKQYTDTLFWLQEIDSIQKIEGEAAQSFETQNDLAYCKIKVGLHQQAIDIWESYYNAGDSSNALIIYNLSGAYYIKGEQAKAINLLKKGLEIAPDYNKKSEWIHLNILKAEIQKTNVYQIINHNFGKENKVKSSLDSIALVELRTQLLWQLYEQQEHFPAPNPIYAHLLFQLGNIHAALNEHKQCLSAYESAYEYGFRDSLMRTRYLHHHEANKLAIWEKGNFVMKYSKHIFMGGMIVVVALLYLIFIRRK